MKESLGASVFFASDLVNFYFTFSQGTYGIFTKISRENHKKTHKASINFLLLFMSHHIAYTSLDFLTKYSKSAIYPKTVKLGFFSLPLALAPSIPHTFSPGANWRKLLFLPINCYHYVFLGQNNNVYTFFV